MSNKYRRRVGWRTSKKNRLPREVVERIVKNKPDAVFSWFLPKWEMHKDELAFRQLKHLIAEVINPTAKYAVVLYTTPEEKRAIKQIKDYIFKSFQIYTLKIGNDKALATLSERVKRRRAVQYCKWHKSKSRA